MRAAKCLWRREPRGYLFKPTFYIIEGLAQVLIPCASQLLVSRAVSRSQLAFINSYGVIPPFPSMLKLTVCPADCHGLLPLPEFDPVSLRNHECFEDVHFVQILQIVMKFRGRHEFLEAVL